MASVPHRQTASNPSCRTPLPIGAARARPGGPSFNQKPCIGDTDGLLLQELLRRHLSRSAMGRRRVGEARTDARCPKIHGRELPTGQLPSALPSLIASTPHKCISCEVCGQLQTFAARKKKLQGLCSTGSFRMGSAVTFNSVRSEANTAAPDCLPQAKDIALQRVCLSA